MAASKAARTGPVARGNRKSVPQSGGRTPASKSVAGSNPRRREARKVTQPPAPSVPNLPKRKPTQTAFPSDRYPTVDPTVIAAAFDRATERDTWQFVEWDAKRQHWTVPSHSRGGRRHIVRLRHPVRAGVPFYVKLDCNCEAGVEGGYLVCYHKCAVFLYWKFEKLTQEAMENGGDIPLPDDWERWYRKR